MSDTEEFDLQASLDHAWQGFARRLAEVISVMDEGAELTVDSIATEYEGRSAYVAFRGLANHRIRAEASSNADLDPGFKLTEAQQEMLRALGWHDPSSDGVQPTHNFWIESPQQESAELAERAVTALRDVFGVPHPAFLAPDQLADILTPAARTEALHQAEVTEFDADDVVAVMPTSRAHLERLVEAELDALYGKALRRDTDEDFAIRVGSTMVFVRVAADAAEVIVFSILVHDVEGRSRAVEVLNDLNTEARYVRFMMIRDRVFATVSVPAQPFVPAHLKQALTGLVTVADSLDEHLAEKLRGRTTFGDSSPPPPHK